MKMYIYIYIEYIHTYIHTYIHYIHIYIYISNSKMLYIYTQDLNDIYKYISI